MEFELYRRIVDKLERLGILFVSIFGGEPTLHPDLVEMVRYARSRGRRIYLSTDLTVVTNKQIDALIRAGTDVISFSLDRMSPTDGNRRTTSTIDGKLDQLLGLQTEGYDFALHCNITWHKQNINEGQAVIDYLHKKGKIMISVRPAVYPIPYVAALGEAKALLLRPEDHEAVQSLLAWVSQKKKDGYLIFSPDAYLTGFSEFVLGNHRWDCGAMRDILSIDADGSLMQCSYFLPEVPPPFAPLKMSIQDLTWPQIERGRQLVEQNLQHCNSRCYSPAYFCTAFYRNHRWKLLKQYLRT
jgi:MoaA/NifB/PqqE/SkfB family radical SAM enzyme